MSVRVSVPNDDLPKWLRRARTARTGLHAAAGESVIPVAGGVGVGVGVGVSVGVGAPVRLERGDEAGPAERQYGPEGLQRLGADLRNDREGRRAHRGQGVCGADTTANKGWQDGLWCGRQ